MKTAHILSTCQCQMFRPYPYLNKLPVLLCCGESKLRLQSYENQIGIGELLSSLRAESARAVTSRRCPHSGVGKDFLERRPGLPHENGRNSGTKSRKLDTKVPKRSQRRGLRTPLWQKTGSHMKKRIFGPKSGFLGPKKKHLLRLAMF